jgi:hypothetical protein
MTLATVRELLAELGWSGLGLTWTLVTTLFTWGAVALAAALALFFAGLRLRWLEPHGKQTWARVTYGLVLFLVFWPAATGVAVVWKVRDKVSTTLIEQCDQRRLTPAVGRIVLLPVLLAHGVQVLGDKHAMAARARDLVRPEAGLADRLRLREGRRELWERFRGKVAKEAKTATAMAGGETDVSFLLDTTRRGDALRALTDQVARRALEHKAESEAEPARRSAVLRLAAWVAARYAAATVEEKLAFYSRALGDVRAGPDGKLTLAQASEQVGRSFLAHTLVKQIEKPFNALRLKLLLLALLPPPLLIGVAQLVGRRRRPTTPVPKDVAGTPTAA